METTSNIDIRRAEMGDVEAIAEIGRSAGMLLDAEEWFADGAQLDGLNCSMFVADYYGAPGAVCRLIRERDRFFLLVFAIHQSLKGHGLGTALMEHVKGRLYGRVRHIDCCVPSDDEEWNDWLRERGFKARTFDTSDRTTILFRYTRPEP